MSLKLSNKEDRYEILTKLGDNLERLNAVINWETFRPILDVALKKEPKGPGGRPAYDRILLFKILVLARLFNLSDDQAEYQINDRLSFMRFLGLGFEDKVPDAKTIWFFRDTLVKANVIDELFFEFNRQLELQGIITRKGTIIDATFINVPRQRNTRMENKTIKEGGIPEDWQSDNAQTKHMFAQKDVDARWAKKNNETHFGYKDHAKVDAESKIITDYRVTGASTPDGEVFLEFITEEDNEIFADSAYAHHVSRIPQGSKSSICERGYNHKPLTEEQKELNRKKSQIRCRIEHVFGFITMSMHGLSIRSIGRKRAKFNIGFINLVYNFCRYAILKRSQPSMA